ncbi:MAG: hypothetical protein J2P16_10720 [Mycobacterium sp.]|nr:hypothetical protein [Mycobacterium sp.]
MVFGCLRFGEAQFVGRHARNVRDVGQVGLMRPYEQHASPVVTEGRVDDESAA